MQGTKLILNLSWEQRSVFTPHADSGVMLPETHIKQLSDFYLHEQCNSFLLHLTNQGQSTTLMGFVWGVKGEGERKKVPLNDLIKAVTNTLAIWLHTLHTAECVKVKEDEVSMIRLRCTSSNLLDDCLFQS